MAITVRALPDAITYGVVTAHNIFVKAVAANGELVHADVTSTSGGDYTAPTSTAYTVTAANASDLATGITLGNECKTVLNVHYADTAAHKVAMTALATAAATDQTTLNTLLNAIKASYNTHRASTTYHYSADSTNVVTASAATDLATSITLANDIKAQMVAHLATGCGAGSIVTVVPA